MTEAQLKSFPAFRDLPIYDEGDEQAIAITSQRYLRECSTIHQVQECLFDARLVPLGALRAGGSNQPVVVAYFRDGEARKATSQ